MKIQEIKPEIDTGALLPGAQFADAFTVALDDTSLDARRAAERMMGQSPRWVETLVSLRNLLVAPFGLKTSGAHEATPRDTIGIFPVLSETPERLIAGFNDSHLDFRVVVDIANAAPGQRVTATTVVLTHNWLGRAYLAIIMPFHKLIVRTMLRQVAV